MPQTELHTAAQNGRVADVERLIAARADVNAKDTVRAARRPPRSASPLPPPAPPPHPALPPTPRRGAGPRSVHSGLFGGRGDRSGRGARKAESAF